MTLRCRTVVAVAENRKVFHQAPFSGEYQVRLANDRRGGDGFSGTRQARSGERSFLLETGLP